MTSAVPHVIEQPKLHDHVGVASVVVPVGVGTDDHGGFSLDQPSLPRHSDEVASAVAPGDDGAVDPQPVLLSDRPWPGGPGRGGEQMSSSAQA